jgi:hypothetical protein
MKRLLALSLFMLVAAFIAAPDAVAGMHQHHHGHAQTQDVAASSDKSVVHEQQADAPPLGDHCPMSFGMTHENCCKTAVAAEALTKREPIVEAAQRERALFHEDANEALHSGADVAEGRGPPVHGLLRTIQPSQSQSVYLKTQRLRI